MIRGFSTEQQVMNFGSLASAEKRNVQGITFLICGIRPVPRGNDRRADGDRINHRTVEVDLPCGLLGGTPESSHDPQKVEDAALSVAQDEGQLLLKVDPCSFSVTPTLMPTRYHFLKQGFIFFH